MRKDPSDPSRSTPDSESAEGEKIGLPSNSPSLPRHPKFLLLQRHTRRSDQFAPWPRQVHYGSPPQNQRGDHPTLQAAAQSLGLRQDRRLEGRRSPAI